QADPNAFYGLM
uniref:Uperin-1.1 n=1 Tax=Uperoleia inundata TaxID=104953 RepID=TKN1_UPEIN|nr:RecName: Full=Uperin-1.1 [Uperoleia inundata]